MESASVEAVKAKYAFSQGAAKLFGSPAPYVVGFADKPEPLDLPYPQLVISAVAGSANLRVGLAEEADPPGLGGGMSEQADPFGPQGLLQLNCFPMWPIAVVEPAAKSDQPLLQMFLDALPDQVRDSLVVMPDGSDLSSTVHDAMRRHAKDLFERMVSADEAVVKLRQMHEETQRAFRELEQFVLNNSKLDTALPPVRLPRGRQSVRLTSGSRAVQRLVAGSYRFSGVEIELLSVPAAGGLLTASVKRAGDSEPWHCWEVDLRMCRPGPLQLRLERASMEQAAGLSLSIGLDLADEQEHLDLAATGPQVLSHMQAEIFPSQSGPTRSQFAIAHAVHRGLPSVQTVKHAVEILNSNRKTAPASSVPDIVLLRSDFERAVVLAPPAAVVAQLGFPVAGLAPENEAELQVHPVQGQPVLVGIPVPGLEIGSLLNVAIYIAHKDAPELLVRLVYGPAKAAQAIQRLLPELLNEAEESGEALRVIGASATECLHIVASDDLTEISLPITNSLVDQPSQLYVAVRTYEEGAGVSYGWFRLREPIRVVQHSAGENACSS